MNEALGGTFTINPYSGLTFCNNMPGVLKQKYFKNVKSMISYFINVSTDPL